jgi:LDH2 family malate/lactate/ureidoglycolate dehydrogenase
MTEIRSRLELRSGRVTVTAEAAIALVSAIFRALGCSEGVAAQVAEHLTDTSLCGMESHGLMRTLQYAEQYRSGYLKADAVPKLTRRAGGGEEVDGGGGIGVPAMHLAYDHGMAKAKENGISALAIRNVGHTGRHGAYADRAADAGYLTIMMGGGNRQAWRQVAPYGGTKALLPTNPYCIGIPGGDRGPVVLDFATSKIAGGWIYAARSAGALLPEDSVIDHEGQPTRDPEDYFSGGAILPAGGQKGYALALMAEVIGEALLGPSTTEGNWLLITLDASRWREVGPMQEAAEAVLAELRTCPPAPGFERVEVPGERERDYREKSAGKIAVPTPTWEQIRALAEELGADS